MNLNTISIFTQESRPAPVAVCSHGVESLFVFLSHASVADTITLSFSNFWCNRIIDGLFSALTIEGLRLFFLSTQFQVLTCAWNSFVCPPPFPPLQFFDGRGNLTGWLRNHVMCRSPSFIERNNVWFKVFSAMTMKNSVDWDKKTHFKHHRKHITSPLQGPAS
jgi:hypothetical protein